MVQIPAYLYSRREFSLSPKNKSQEPGPGSSTPEPKSILPKFLTGSFAFGSVLLAAYYFGVLERLSEEQQRLREYNKARNGDKKTQIFQEQQNAYNQASELSKSIADNSSKESDVSSFDSNHAKQDFESIPDESTRTEEDKSTQSKDMAVLTPENVDDIQGREMPHVSQSSVSSDDATSKPAQESFDLKIPGEKPDEEQYKAIEVTPNLTSAVKTPAEIEVKSVPEEQTTTQDMKEVKQGFVAGNILTLFTVPCYIGKSFTVSCEATFGRLFRVMEHKHLVPSSTTTI